MKIFDIPVKDFAVPFDKVWKRLLMHFLINLIVGAIVYPLWMPDLEYQLILYLKVSMFFFTGDISQAFIHLLIYIKLNKRYDWLKDTKKRVTYAIVLHTVGTFAIYFTVPCLYMYFVFHLPIAEAFSNLLYTWIIPIAIVGFVMVFAVAGEFFKNWKSSLASEEKMHAEMMNYKYESLRNQINPHFLLDSFSLLKKLVFKDQETAVQFIQKISSLYRHVLEVKDKEFILLKEELEYVNSYISLLKLRYEGQLKIDVNIIAEKDDLVAPLSLQRLIENAVESNIGSEEDLLEIGVKRTEGCIEISNSKNQSKRYVDLHTVSLKNLEQQYEFYSKKRIEFQETQTTFAVKIPILKQVV
jgi:uncharacterized membrane protein (DUF485 family)